MELAKRILELRSDSGNPVKKKYSFEKKIVLSDGYSLYKFTNLPDDINGSDRFILSLPCRKEINYHIFYIPLEISGCTVKEVLFEKEKDKLLIKTKGKKWSAIYEWDYKDDKTVFTHENLKCIKLEEGR